ncbi:unnamed protein product [Nesidiocoris tenuis]|uniref:Uncharacterized protein n=1 Tax=Nesidiocoris tenuis TaxID=355587 RepID=A0A6H5HH96_9HEMI|nr:unnamed protein product [Nesidiocoris tenuis]
MFYLKRSQNMIKFCHTSSFLIMEVLCVIYAPLATIEDRSISRRTVFSLTKSVQPFGSNGFSKNRLQTDLSPVGRESRWAARAGGPRVRLRTARKAVENGNVTAPRTTVAARLDQSVTSLRTTKKHSLKKASTDPCDNNKIRPTTPQGLTRTQNSSIRAVPLSDIGDTFGDNVQRRSPAGARRCHPLRPQVRNDRQNEFAERRGNGNALHYQGQSENSKWKYCDRPKIENRNGASEKTFSYTHLLRITSRTSVLDLNFNGWIPTSYELNARTFEQENATKGAYQIGVSVDVSGSAGGGYIQIFVSTAGPASLLRPTANLTLINRRHKGQISARWPPRSNSSDSSRTMEERWYVQTSIPIIKLSNSHETLRCLGPSNHARTAGASAAENDIPARIQVFPKLSVSHFRVDTELGTADHQ